MNQGSLGTISVDLILSDAKFKQALDGAVREATQAADKINTAQAAATERLSGRFANIGALATRAFAATGIAAAAAGIASVKMAGDFEQSLNVFKSVSGATAAQMAEVAKRARELGNDASLPGISARDAAQALTELAKAGLTVNQSLAASKGVLSLAKAGNLDVADAANTAARALTAFGLSGDKATQVADVLAAAANSSTASVQDMGLGLAQASSGASQMGVSLQDTVTALALFANHAIVGQDAGTSLKQMFLQLVNPSKDAANTMRELGLKFFDAQGNFVGLSAAAGQLHDKLAKLTPEQRNAALAIIFGSDAARVAGVLANEGAKGFDAMAKSVNKAGAATELAAAQNSGFNGALDNLVSTLQTIGIEIGTTLLPPLTAFLKRISADLPAAVDFMSQHMGLFAAAAVALGAAFATIKIASFIRDIRLAGNVLKVFIGKDLANGVKALGTGFKVMGGEAVAGFGAAEAGAISLRGVLVTTGIGAIVVALGIAADLLITKWDKVGPAFQRMGAQVASAFRPVLDALSAFGALLGRTVGPAVDGIVRAFNEHLLPAFERNKKMIELVTGAVVAFTALPFIAFVVSVGAAVYGLAKVFSLIAPAISATIDWFSRFIDFVGGVFRRLEQLPAAAVKAFQDASGAVAASFSDMVKSVRDAGTAIDGGLHKAFDGAAKVIEPWRKNFLGTLTSSLQDAAKAMLDYDSKTLASWGDWISKTVKAVQDWGVNVGAQIGTALSGLVKTISDNVAGIPAAFGSWIGGTIKAVQDWGSSLATNGGKAVTDFVTSVGNFFGSLPATIGTKLNDVATAVTSFFTQLPANLAKIFDGSGQAMAGNLTGGFVRMSKSQDTINRIGDAVIGGFVLAIATVIIYLVDSGVRIGGAILRMVAGASRAAVQAGGNLIGGLVQGIESGSGAVVNKIKEICASALNAVKAFFGIHSPSTVMAQMGTYLMQGFANGISSSSNLAENAVQAVSDSVGASLAKASSGSLGVTGNVDLAAAQGQAAGNVTFNNTYNIQGNTDLDLVNRELLWNFRNA